MKNAICSVLRVLAVIICIIAVALGWNIYDVNTISVNSYEVYSRKISTDFNRYKIAFIADYHNAEYYDKIIKKLNEQSPDLILLGGDMVNLDEDTYENTMRLLPELVKTAPVYMVMGNHEIFHDKLEQIKTDFAAAGVNFLNDEGVKIQKNESYIKLYGMKDPAIKDSEITVPGKIEKTVAKAKREVDVNTLSLMVMHRANMYDMVYDTGYDLILSGHIHGGVVRIPFIGGVFTPERDRWFPEYTKGLYSLGKSQMIVSAGLDKQKSKPRVFNGPEIVMVTLKKG